MCILHSVTQAQLSRVLYTCQPAHSVAHEMLAELSGQEHCVTMDSTPPFSTPDSASGSYARDLALPSHP